jgi:hypothetical protein
VRTHRAGSGRLGAAAIAVTACLGCAVGPASAPDDDGPATIPARDVGATTAPPPTAAPEGLRVSSGGRHLETLDGRPFFWLGDTAWELFHRLDREEADLYLATRAAQGFNVVQAVVLAEQDGLGTPQRGVLRTRRLHRRARQ